MKYVLLKGDPVNGFSCIGPFQSEDDAMSWAMVEWDHESDWWPMEMTHPDKDFNDEPVICVTCGTDRTCADCIQDEADSRNARIISDPEEIARILGDTSGHHHSHLPKAVMMDLSEIADS